MITLQLSNHTARRLSYLIGRSDEANAVVEAAMGAAKVAEQSVRDVIALVANESGEALPGNYNVEFKDELNQLVITSKDEEQTMNGVSHES